MTRLTKGEEAAILFLIGNALLIPLLITFLLEWQCSSSGFQGEVYWGLLFQYHQTIELLRPAVIWGVRWSGPECRRKREGLAQPPVTFSLWFTALCTQWLVTLETWLSRSQPPEADGGCSGPLAQGHLAARAGSPSWVSNSPLSSRTCQLRLETGLPWNFFLSLLAVFLKLYHFISL